MKNNDYIKIFCDNVKELRKANRLSKREMADKLHIGLKTLDNIEKGILPNRLSLRIVFLLQSNFGITAKQLFSSTNK